MNTLDIIILIILLIGGLNGFASRIYQSLCELGRMDIRIDRGGQIRRYIGTCNEQPKPRPCRAKIAAFRFYRTDHCGVYLDCFGIVEWPLEKFETGPIKSFSRWGIWFPERFTDCFGHHAGRWSVGGKLTTLETVKFVQSYYPMHL